MKAIHRSGLWHGLGQALVIGFGWVSFGWMWLLVVQRPWEVHGLVWLIGASLIVLPVVTLYWVWHNRSIHRRKGPRRAVAVVNEHYLHDWSGRAVQADWPMLRLARSITVHIGDDSKSYQIDAAPATASREQILT